MVAAITIARPDRYGSELVYFHSTNPEEPGKTSIVPTVLATAKPIAFISHGPCAEQTGHGTPSDKWIDMFDPRRLMGQQADKQTGVPSLCNASRKC